MLVILQQDAELQVKWLPGLQAALPPSLLTRLKPQSTENTILTIHS